MRKISAKAVAITLTIFLLGGFGAIYLYFNIQFDSVIRRHSERQAQILYQTDHEILAAEARRLAGQLQEEHNLRSDMPIQELKQGDPAIPICLAILKPRSITIFSDFVKLEFGGALWHYGIIVYNKGLEGPGTRKLGEGVWFYSENGRYPGPNGEKRKGPPTG